MASTVTLLQMRTKARQHADQENSPFIGDTELTAYINSAIQELYDMLIQAGEYYYIANEDVTISANVDTYDLPDDFYKLLGIDLVFGNGQNLSLKPFNFTERNRYNFYPEFGYSSGNNLKYIIQGDQLKFIPIPVGSNQIKVWYAPVFTPLVDDADTFDGINGWEDMAVLDAAIKMMIKEESDPQALMLERQRIEARIQKISKSRNFESGGKVTDIYANRDSRRYIGEEYF